MIKVNCISTQCKEVVQSLEISRKKRGLDKENMKSWEKISTSNEEFNKLKLQQYWTSLTIQM